MADSSKRYANSPKAPKKKGAGDGSLRKSEGAAVGEAKKDEKKEGEGKGPVDAKPGPVGKVGEDPGPDKGESGPEFGVVAERHKSEHGAMIKRHAEELGATHERHGKEAKDMMARHHKELQDHMEAGAEHKAQASAGAPKELGKDKDEGKKGSEV